MTHDFRRPDGRDPALTRALRDLLAAPADAGYWDSLEARVMARVLARGQEPGPWSVLLAWARPAMVAAASVALGVYWMLIS